LVVEVCLSVSVNIPPFSVMTYSEQLIDLFVTIVKYTNVHLQIDKPPPPSQEC
jgi:hypothetical protein